MQKTRNRDASTNVTTFRGSYHAISEPDVVNMDVLGTLLDDELIVRLRSLTDACDQAAEARLDTKPWETEIAYVRREQQIRRGHHETHVNYVKCEQEAFEREERMLPKGDFDNVAFVYAETGGRPRWS